MQAAVIERLLCGHGFEETGTGRYRNPEGLECAPFSHLFATSACRHPAEPVGENGVETPSLGMILELRCPKSKSLNPKVQKPKPKALRP